MIQEVRLRAELKLDLKNHLRVKQSITRGTGPVPAILDSWEETYRAFLLRRFDKFSMGGGNWPRLKASTRARKKKNKDKILVHTRFMRMKLEHGIKSIRRSRGAVVFGFVMGMMHPDSDLTVAQLATIHDRGLGVPQRRILVLPDRETVAVMRKSQKQILVDEMNGKRTSNGGSRPA